MIKIILLILISMNLAYASGITEAFDKKEYRNVIEMYQKQKGRSFSKEEEKSISYSFKKLRLYAEDITLSREILMRNFSKKHEKLRANVQAGETIDGDDYSEEQKELYWNLMTNYGLLIEGKKKAKDLRKNITKTFTFYTKLLSELEYKEGKVDKFNDRVLAHVEKLKSEVYKFRKTLSVQYISWQTESRLKSPTTSTRLNITNRGLCAGGDIGYQNAKYHFYVDTCFFAGSGGVSSHSTIPKYQQSNVTAYGLKVSPGFSRIVSSSGSKLGIRLPLLYTVQKLQQPSSTTFSVEQISPFNAVASLFSLWHFQRWYFQTEIGKYLENDQTLWGVGVGRTF